MENCENCYYSKEACEGVWLCRRYPPSIGPFHNHYPEVASGKWCGEYEPKDGKGKRWQLRGTMYEEDALPERVKYK